jgi:hypothetical protein
MQYPGIKSLRTNDWNEKDCLVASKMGVRRDEMKSQNYEV